MENTNRYLPRVGKHWLQKVLYMYLVFTIEHMDNFDLSIILFETINRKPIRCQTRHCFILYFVLTDHMTQLKKKLFIHNLGQGLTTTLLVADITQKKIILKYCRKQTGIISKLFLKLIFRDMQMPQLNQIYIRKNTFFQLQNIGENQTYECIIIH